MKSLGQSPNIIGGSEMRVDTISTEYEISIDLGRLQAPGPTYSEASTRGTLFPQLLSAGSARQLA
jgi:hypothetical protein